MASYNWHSHYPNMPYPTGLPSSSCNHLCSDGSTGHDFNPADYDIDDAMYSGYHPIMSAIPSYHKSLPPIVDGASLSADDFSEIFSGGKHSTDEKYALVLHTCSRKRPTATKKQREEAKIPSSYLTSQWNPAVSRPLTLRNYVFDANSIGTFIYEWTKLSKNDDMIDLSKRLRNGLRNLAYRGNKMRVGLEDDKIFTKVEDLDNAEYFLQRVKGLLDKFEDILADTTKKMTASVENVRGMELISFLFNEQMARTQKFVEDLELWILRINVNLGEVLGVV